MPNFSSQVAAYSLTVREHPPFDDVFKALSHGSRRQLLDRLNHRNGQTLRELCGGLDMARQSVSKHLAVLEAANLVTTIRRGEVVMQDGRVQAPPGGGQYLPVPAYDLIRPRGVLANGFEATAY